MVSTISRRMLVRAAAVVLAVNLGLLVFQFRKLRQVVAFAREKRAEGHASRHKEMLDEAAKRYETALALLTQVGAGMSPEVASCLEDLGWTQAERGRLAAATNSYRRAIAIREALAPADRALVPPLVRLGALYRDSGDLVASCDTLRRALDQCDRARNTTLVTSRDAHIELSRTYRLQRRLQSALEHAQLAVDASPLTTDWNYENATTSFPELGHVEWELGHLDNAHQIFVHCLHLVRAVAPVPHATVGAISLLIADVRIAKGDLVQARDIVKNLLQLIKLRSLGDRDADVWLLDASLAWKEGDAKALDRMLAALARANDVIRRYPDWLVGNQQRLELVANAAGALAVDGPARALFEREVAARRWMRYRERPLELTRASHAQDIYQKLYVRARQRAPN
jgi:tetratricopeptide (TPR) repeat protein